MLDVISKPFKVGRERSDDDVSLFILYEFVVHARLAGADLGGEQVVEIAERIEAQAAAVPGTGRAQNPLLGGQQRCALAAGPHQENGHLNGGLVLVTW